MARISGVNIPLNKRVEIGLTYIYGVGRPTSNKLLAELGISPDTYVKDLTDDEVSKLRDLIDRESIVFLDTETTGLATAAGTVAFLIGLGWWTGTTRS